MESPISLIVTCRNVEAYVAQALGSAVEQSVPFARIIVIDDASTDGTTAILEDLSARCDRIDLVRNAVQRGLGASRNIGLARVSTDYVMFLDGDDWFEPDAVERIVPELDHLGPTDLLIFNHARSYPGGVTTPNPDAALLDFRRYASPAQKREILRNLNVAWNKVYATRLIADNALRFPDGYYEDIPWTYACILLAGVVHSLPDVLIRYRQRDGSILPPTKEDRQ